MRYRIVNINSVFLEKMFIEGNELHVKCISGLPEGAKFKYLIPDLAGISLVFEHESFKQLEDGEQIPLHHKVAFNKLD